MVLFGIVGYLFKKFSFEAAPLVLAFVLSPMLENAFRQALIMSGGSSSIFFTRPISLVLLLIAIALLLLPLIPNLKRIPKGETN
jgi:putative tricarboxylic transport membrane protein